MTDGLDGCGLTAFSNLLQQLVQYLIQEHRCGLTAFSNLLQPHIPFGQSVFSCGLTAFSNLLQLIST